MPRLWFCDSVKHSECQHDNSTTNDSKVFKLGTGNDLGIKVNGKGSAPSTEAHLWSAHHGSHSFYTANTPWCLHLVNIYQRAWPLASGSSHLITAYYSFIDPEKMKGWVGLVGWPTADGLLIQMVTQLQRPTFYHWATQPTGGMTLVSKSSNVKVTAGSQSAKRRSSDQSMVYYCYY